MAPKRSRKIQRRSRANDSQEGTRKKKSRLSTATKEVTRKRNDSAVNCCTIQFEKEITNCDKKGYEKTESPCEDNKLNAVATTTNDALDNESTEKITKSGQMLTEFGKCESTTPLKTKRYRFVSWNINSVRAWIKHRGLEFFERQTVPFDIIALQEMKCGKNTIPVELRKFSEERGYTCYTLCGHKDGYAGVAVLTRIRPNSVRTDMSLDNEGRVIGLQYDAFSFVNCYTPNSGVGLKRLEYRMQWNKAFLNTLSEQSKPIILCGDLNVAHMPIKQTPQCFIT